MAHTRFVTRTGFYMLNGRRRHVSWHYTVDDGRVVKHLPINEVAFHAGPGNAKSIAIEICMHQGIDQAAANDRAVRLVAALMHDIGITSSNVVSHEFWTGKHCPTLLLGDFDGFVSAAQTIFNSIEPGVTEDVGEADDLVTAEERAAIREAVNDGTEAFDPDLLEADDPHPGTLEIGATETEPGA